MAADSNSTDESIRIVPVFPLPDTVFFPRTSLPLHIFEPRYRAMVKDVTAGDGLIVVSRIAGDDFEELATVGRVQDLEPLEDGRFNLRLEGLYRVGCAEISCDTPYRQVRIEPRPERPGTEDATVIEKAKLELQGTLGILLSVAQQDVPIVLDQEATFEAVVNKACARLPVDSSLRQQLLAEDDLLQRQRLVSQYLTAVIEAIASLGNSGPGGGATRN